ncbi:hypothetical protein H0H81_001948, partial [Sphagnurus paluster]
ALQADSQIERQVTSRDRDQDPGISYKSSSTKKVQKGLDSGLAKISDYGKIRGKDSNMF